MTYGAFQQAFFSKLQTAGIPIEEVRALWARWTEWKHGNRVAYSLKPPDFPLPEPEEAQAVVDRLMRHEPWAHIRGQVDFAGLTLSIDPRALIPRPETEEVLSLALAVLPAQGRMLDWCSGSGCIALGAKAARTDSYVEGWEWSTDALALARQNAEANNLDVPFQRADLNEWPSRGGGLWDVIVSNPPYIHPSEILESSVQDYEPHAALYSPREDVLHFYRRLKIWAETQLVPQGYLVLECHSQHARATSELFGAGWRQPEIHVDFCGKERAIRVQRV
ncbi:MAG TPA: peptide chain release factor N(5)-glutamine methyltransferase [Cryomorphaceae bacterium]|nr:peptide chain release factor N(5)-glutamine methyltransferase [Cryomorphaceae bacterium]